MRKLMAVLISLLLVWGCAGAEGNPAAMDDNAIVEEVIKNMSLLTQIPRPSCHEEKVSEFFMEWAREHGYEPVRDEIMNVMFEVPATAGLECGTFKTMNPSIDLISIGPDLKGVHTVNETFYLDTLPKVWHLLEGLLQGV